ncbi:hypothetical protein Pint_03937 [Pistacia integerrima]|uniref:Uncharacterized protein n=1 Tax=Pistacia integerrima TaxID=434235 RepID=A0ACC0Z4H0_9ROSI|nr:hypothetical protein Pint_03937 [Pistacia integerrima]
MLLGQANGMLSWVLYPVGRVVTYLSMEMLKALGLKGRSELYVIEDELKLMLRGAELSGAIKEEEQIKDTHVGEVMTRIVDVVAIDVSATLVDFHSLVPLFEQLVDNIMGIAYAMDLLDMFRRSGDFYSSSSLSEVDLLESTTVRDMAHKPAYFIPDSMTIWNLLREFHIRKGHQYETVLLCLIKSFGYIPRTGENMKVVLEKENQEENEEHYESGSDCQELKEKHLIYKLEVWS